MATRAISRRTFLRHAPKPLALTLGGTVASTAALAVPVIAAVTPPAETPLEKVRRLQHELSDALAELAAERADPSKTCARKRRTCRRQSGTRLPASRPT